jgi:hypothetical protein
MGRTTSRGTHSGIARSSADVIERKDDGPKEPEPVLVITIYGQRAVSRGVEMRLVRENAERCIREFDGNPTGEILADVLIHPSEPRALLASWEFTPRSPL